MELATGFPGNTGIRPREITTLAEILRQNGYSTAAFGKYHETPPWEVSVLRVLTIAGRRARASTSSTASSAARPISGRRRHWTTAWSASSRRRRPDYHFTADMTDQAINWVSAQKALTPDKPFYLYFAPGATHAPHHVPKEWIRQIQGPVRRRLGQAARGDLRAAEEARRHPRGHEADARARGDPGWDDMSADAEAAVRAADGNLRRLRRAHRRTRSAGSSRSSSRSARWRTRSFSTSSATTARAPRAAPRAPTTR